MAECDITGARNACCDGGASSGDGTDVAGDSGAVGGDVGGRGYGSEGGGMGFRGSCVSRGGYSARMHSVTVTPVPRVEK
jgi:hypothetical protein